MRTTASQKSPALLILLAATTLLYAGVSNSSLAAHDQDASSGTNSQNPEISTSPLDFNIYRARIEPVFLKKRQGDMRCYDCHSVMNTRLCLQPLSAGESTWSEVHSRQNFAVVSRLVTLGEPTKSRLLLHPLAPEAGGDPTHTGGKFWASQSDSEWKMIAEWISNGNASSLKDAHPDKVNDNGAAFASYKQNVEPVFLKERPGHARCYGCHSEGNRLGLFKPSQLVRSQSPCVGQGSFQIKPAVRVHGQLIRILQKFEHCLDAL